MEKYGTSRLIKRELKRMMKISPKQRRKEKESEILGGTD